MAREVDAGAFRDAFRFGDVPLLFAAPLFLEELFRFELLVLRGAEVFFEPARGFGEDVVFEAGLFADDFLAEVFAAGLRADFAGAFLEDDLFAAELFDAVLVGADFLDVDLFEADFFEDDFFTLPERALPAVFLELAAIW